jgi:hypothetical protein
MLLIIEIEIGRLEFGIWRLEEWEIGRLEI